MMQDAGEVPASPSRTGYVVPWCRVKGSNSLGHKFRAFQSRIVCWDLGFRGRSRVWGSGFGFGVFEATHRVGGLSSYSYKVRAII